MAEIRELITPQRACNEATVKLLRDVLADAEAGKIESVMVIGFSPRGRAQSAFSPGLNAIEKIGALELIKGEIVFGIVGTAISV